MSQVSFYFDNISCLEHKKPIISIHINFNEVFYGQVCSSISVQSELKDLNYIQIYFKNKLPEDTTDEKDLNFSLQNILIDDDAFDELLWQGSYHYDDQKIDSCLFFGPKGYYQICFQMPFALWKLKSKDASVTDNEYKLYKNACQILSQI